MADFPKLKDSDMADLAQYTEDLANALAGELETINNEISETNKSVQDLEENVDQSIQDLQKNVTKNTNDLIATKTFIENSMKTLSEEGTSIHVNDSADYPCKLRVEGKSEQTQTEQGKNLLDLEELNSSTETWIVSAKKLTLTLKPNTQYTCSSNVPAPEDFSASVETGKVLYFNDNSWSGDGGVCIGRSKTTTTDENGNLFIAVALNRTYSEELLNGTYYIQIEEGATSTEFEAFVPDSPSPNYRSDIENVSGDLEVKVVGKNLFNINEVKQAGGESSTEINGNILTLTATGTLGAQYSQYFLKNVNFEKTYIFSFKVKKIVAGNNSLLRVMVGGSNDGKKYTFIKNIDKTGAQTNVEYSLSGTFSGYSHYRFYIYNNVSTPVIIGEQTKYYNIQVEEGTVATEYEPYKEQTVTFPLGEQKLMKDGYLASDGIHNKRKQVVLDGTETWTLYSSSLNALRYSIYITISDMYISAGGLDDVHSNYFIGDGSSESTEEFANKFTIRRANSSNKVYFFIPKDFFEATTANEIIAEWKAYLAEQNTAGTPVILEYPLAEEETTAYTEEQRTAYNELQKLKTYRTVTNISNSQDTNMQLTYKMDLQTQLQEIETMLLESGV